MTGQSPSEFDHKAFLPTLTTKPGVYQMLDGGGQVLYVGKAKNLKNRVSSYFRTRGLNNKTTALVSRICSIQVTVTRTEAEALLLEQNLIKQHRPPYNILLRDDKSYPYIQLTDHEFPQLAYYRGSTRKPGRFFGPYPSAGSVRESLQLLQKVFRVRQCDDAYFRNRSRPCLQYQIGRCSGPCVGMVDVETYQHDVRHTVMFLEGRSSAVIAELANTMERAAIDLQYEQAAVIRDQITALQQVQQSQYIESGESDADIFAIALDRGLCCIQVVYVRGGRVLGSRSHFPRLQLDENRTDALGAFMAQFYLASEREVPRLIITSEPLGDAALLEELLAQRVGYRPGIVSNVRTHRQQWLQLALRTAEQNLLGHLADKKHHLQRLEALQELLHLDEPPKRLECFDISHSHGEATVASCVVFDNGVPLKSDYRRFNINGITPGDDYAAMKQALERRYTRARNEGAVLPDILFIDGGKGQVHQAWDVLRELQIQDDIMIIGVAKGRSRKPGLETLVFPPDYAEVHVDRTSPALHLIQYIRDESHRFAITGHKQRRDKARRSSTLEEISGVGAKRRRELLRHFGSLMAIKQASIEDLARVPGISQKLAEQIHSTFNAS